MGKAYKKILKNFQNASVIAGLVIGFWIYMQYSSDKLSKDTALFYLSILSLALFGTELIISLITKESVIQAGSVSKKEFPKYYNVAVTLKVVFCTIAVLGIIIYYPN